ncbi:MAG: AAA family ATPase [Azospirillaceae bacterium]
MGPISTAATARSLDPDSDRNRDDDAPEPASNDATAVPEAEPVDAPEPSVAEAAPARPEPAPECNEPRDAPRAPRSTASDETESPRAEQPASAPRSEPSMADPAAARTDRAAPSGAEPTGDEAEAAPERPAAREPVWTPAPARPPATRAQVAAASEDDDKPAEDAAPRGVGGLPARQRRGGFFRHDEEEGGYGPARNPVARSTGRPRVGGALTPYTGGAEPAGTLPGFRLPPADLRFGTRSNNDTEQKSASLALLETFTPTKPKRRAELFAGRRHEIERVIAAIEEEQASVVIYGERGLGKTSLANIVCDSARKVGYLVVRCACSTEISFEEMMRTLFSGISGRYLSSQAAKRDGQRVDALAELLPDRPFGVTEVAAAARHLTGGHALFVLDEFDRIKDERVKNHLAEVIKNLSDLSCGISFLILGVSTTIDDLMGHHASIQRNVVGVRLPLMSPEEVDATIDLGEEASGVRFDREMRRAVVAFSGGMPYAVQLLCLYAGRNAVARGALAVEHTDLEGALRRALDDLDRAVVDIYEQATRCETSETMTDIVFAAAAAICDEYGRFAPADVEEALDTRGREPLHGLTLRKALSKLCRPEHGEMLADERTAAGETLYRFRNQLTRLYVFGRQARRRGMF